MTQVYSDKRLKISVEKTPMLFLIVKAEGRKRAL